MPSSNKARKAAASARPQVADEPVATDTSSKYAPSAWGTGSGLEDIEVPSGQLCQVKRPGVQGLIAAGVLRDVDQLTGLVNSKHIERVEGKADIAQSELEAFARDPEAVNHALHLVDRVICYMVVQPKVYMTPNDPTNRKRDVVYADMVDLEDKMFLFNYAVGGTRDIERFRGESGGIMGSLDDGEAVADTTGGVVQDQG